MEDLFSVDVDSFWSKVTVATLLHVLIRLIAIFGNIVTCIVYLDSVGYRHLHTVLLAHWPLVIWSLHR